jgi:hypothetical protein
MSVHETDLRDEGSDLEQEPLLDVSNTSVKIYYNFFLLPDHRSPILG